MEIVGWASLVAGVGLIFSGYLGQSFGAVLGGVFTTGKLPPKQPLRCGDNAPIKVEPDVLGNTGPGGAPIDPNKPFYTTDPGAPGTPYNPTGPSELAIYPRVPMVQTPGQALNT